MDKTKYWKYFSFLFFSIITALPNPTVHSQAPQETPYPIHHQSEGRCHTSCRSQRTPTSSRATQSGCGVVPLLPCRFSSSAMGNGFIRTNTRFRNIWTRTRVRSRIFPLITNDNDNITNASGRWAWPGSEKGLLPLVFY